MKMGTTTPVPPPLKRQDQADVGVGSEAEHERTVGTSGYVFSCLAVLPTLLFFSLFFFLVVLFAAECSNELGGNGRDQPGRRQKRGAGRGGARGAYSVVFFL